MVSHSLIVCWRVPSSSAISCWVRPRWRRSAWTREASQSYLILLLAIGEVYTETCIVSSKLKTYRKLDAMTARRLPKVWLYVALSLMVMNVVALANLVDGSADFRK